MKILGIDPGTALVGWGVITDIKNTQTVVDYGCITTTNSQTPADRLLIVHKQLSELIKRHKPECLSLEELFFSTNVKTALAVGQSRGVIMLTAAMNNIPVISYTPLTVKLTICGYGRAEKSQVQRMVKQILKLSEIPKPDDTADALAIALTHAFSNKMKKILTA